jgi:urease accessory protein
MRRSIRRFATLLAIATVAVQAPAFAHHVMGGELPQTFLQGFLSGLGHPVIGLDHLGAIVGVGILAALARRGVGPLFAFSLALIAGVTLHLAKANVPAGELLVGLSTLAIGGLVALRQPMRLTVAVALFAIAGVIHGYALGESIVGAEPAPLWAYLAGLLIIQTVLGLAAFAAVSNLVRWPALLRTAGLTVVGILVALAGGVTAAYAAGLVT